MTLDFRLEEKKYKEKKRSENTNDHQQQHTFQQSIILPLIEDITPKDPATMPKTLGEIQNYQDNLQIYESDLVKLMILEQQNKEHKE